MGQSYRIRTELGINKTINVQLDQDFEFLEILSLKIQQTDVIVEVVLNTVLLLEGLLRITDLVFQMPEYLYSSQYHR